MGQAGMRWGKSGWDLGSLAGHGFGGGLFPLAPLRGLQARCSGRCGKPLGLFWPLCPGVPSSPQSLWALPEMGGQRGDRAGCGGEGGKGSRRESSKRPLGPSPAPPPPSGWTKDGGGCGAVEGGRAVWARGACTESPNVRACVRGAGPARRPSRPGRGQEGRGAGLSLGSPCLRAGPRERGLP